MKLLVLILPVLWFLYQSKAPGNFRPYHSYNVVDTPIVGLVVPDQGEEPPDSTPPPPDTIPIPPSGGRSHLLMEELYNDLPLDPLINGYNQAGGDCCAWSQGLSDSMFNTSPTSMRFEVRRTDPLIAGSPRSEDNVNSKFEPALNFERWYGVALGFPLDYLIDVSPEIVTQLHALDSNPPPVAIWTQNDHIYFVFKGGTIKQDYGLIPKGTFVKLVFHVIWDTDGSHGGLIEIWMNGVKLTSLAGANSPPGLPYGPYMKVGLYCWKWSHGYPSNINTRVLYVDDWRIGDALATYNDVVP